MDQFAHTAVAVNNLHTMTTTKSAAWEKLSSGKTKKEIIKDMPSKPNKIEEGRMSVVDSRPAFRFGVAPFEHSAVTVNNLHPMTTTESAPWQPSASGKSKTEIVRDIPSKPGNSKVGHR